MRTIKKGNYRVVYDPAKGESMSMLAVYKKNMDGSLSLLDKEMGTETEERKLQLKAIDIINGLIKKEG